mmetsp:Transcript_35399/g.77955  ORF Transcript_35399/g.77955 Transcript_35399/m.77955 type:complete len:305 (+) Transcript_35399:504-1418(+)
MPPAGASGVKGARLLATSEHRPTPARLPDLAPLEQAVCRGGHTYGVFLGGWVHGGVVHCVRATGRLGGRRYDGGPAHEERVEVLDALAHLQHGSVGRGAFDAAPVRAVLRHCDSHLDLAALHLALRGPRQGQALPVASKNIHQVQPAAGRELVRGGDGAGSDDVPHAHVVRVEVEPVPLLLVGAHHRRVLVQLPVPEPVLGGGECNAPCAQLQHIGGDALVAVLVPDLPVAALPVRRQHARHAQAEHLLAHGLAQAVRADDQPIKYIIGNRCAQFYVALSPPSRGEGRLEAGSMLQRAEPRQQP